MPKVTDQRPNASVPSLGAVKAAVSSRPVSSISSTAPKPGTSTSVQGQ